MLSSSEAAWRAKWLAKRYERGRQTPADAQPMNQRNRRKDLRRNSAGWSGIAVELTAAEKAQACRAAAEAQTIVSKQAVAVTESQS